MRELIAEEFLYVLLPLLITFASVVYYRERGVVHLNPYSTFWPRLFALIVDAAVLWPVVRTLPRFLNYVLGFSEAESLVLFSGAALVIPLYSLILHGVFGATVGKFVTKILLARTQKKVRCDFKQAFLRDSVPLVLSLIWLVWVHGVQTEPIPFPTVADLMIPLIYLAWYLIELLTMPSNSKRRSVQDLMAGTVVIRYDWN